MEVGRLTAVVEADTSRFKRGMVEAENQVKSFASNSERNTTGAVNAIISKLDVLKVAAGAAFIKVGKDVIGAGFSFNSMKEQATIAFSTLMGSSDAARQHIADLTTFAAKTPFEMPALLKASQQLQAMGFHASEVVPTLTSIGDAAAAMGGSAETIEGITRALVQIKAKGKASAEEMLQLAERGIPAWQMLADRMGTSVPEAMKKVSKGAVDADSTIAALLQGMSSRFGGMMEAQSKSFNGLVSTLKDNAMQLAGSVLEPVFNRVRDGMQRIVDSMPDIQRGIESAIISIQVPFEGFISFIKTTAVEFAAQFKGMGDSFARLKDDAINAFKSIEPAFNTVKDTFRSLVVGIGGVIADLIKFYEAHKAAFDAQWGAVLQTIKTVAETIHSQVQVIIGITRTFIKFMSGDFSGAWEFLKKTAESYWEGLKNLTSNSLKLVGSILSAGWETIKSAASIAWQAIGKLPGLAWQGIKAGVGFLIDTIVGFWTGLPGFILKAIQKIPEIVGSILGYAAKGAITVLGGLLVGIGGLFVKIGETVWSGIKKAAEFVWEGAKSLVTKTGEILADLPNVFVSAVESVFNFLKSVPGKIWEFAKSIGKAFIDGITSPFKGHPSGEPLGFPAWSPFRENVWGPMKKQAETAGVEVGGAWGRSLEQVVTEATQTVEQLVNNAFNPKNAAAATGGASRAGKAMAEALIDGFSEGLKGWESAVAIVTKNASQIEALFDPMSRAAKKAAKETIDGLKTVTSGVNDYLSALGIAARLSEAEMGRMVAPGGDRSLLTLADNWKHVEERVRQAGLELGRQGVNLNRINEMLSTHGSELQITEDHIRSLIGSRKELSEADKKLIADLQKLTDQFQKNQEAIARQQLETARATAGMNILKSVGGGLLNLLSPMTDGFKQLGDMFGNLSLQATTAIDRLRGLRNQLLESLSSLQNLPTLQKLNLRLEIGDAITSQLERLARVSGRTFESVASQWRNMVTQAGPLSAELRQIIADVDQSIINSRLSRLDEAWGEPIGKAIAGILDHFGKLQNAAANVRDDLLAKVTAIGELFGALPGKIGSSVSKVINEINKWLNLTQKALAVLDAFGVKIPGTLGKVLDVLTGGAQSTQRVMIQMKDEVARIMTELKDEVVRIFGQMTSSLKEQMDAMRDAAGIGAQATATSFIGGISGLPQSVGGVFGGVAGSVIKAIESIINATRNMGATLPPIYTMVGNAATQMSTQISIAMSNAATATRNANASMVSSTSRMAAGVMGIIGGLTTFLGTRNQGLARGVLGGAAAGAQVGAGIGFMIGGPVGAGIGTAIGAIGGAIVGIFGSGKTELQKLQEQAQKAQAQEAIKQAGLQTQLLGEQLKQSYVDTVDKIRGLAEGLRFYTSIGEQAIEAFAADANKLIAAIVRSARRWKDVAGSGLKETAEHLTAGFEMFSHLPGLMDAVSRHFRLSDTGLAGFMADAENFIVSLAEMVAGIPRKVARSIRQFNDRIGESFNFVSPLIESIKAMFDLRRPAADAFSIVRDSLHGIVEGIGSVAEAIPKDLQRAIGFFASQVGPSIELWKATVENIRAMVDLPAIAPAAFTSLFDAMGRGIQGMVTLAGQLSGEGLLRAEAMAQAALSIFGAMKSAIDSLGALRDYKSIASESFALLREDFSRVNSFLGEMIQFANGYKSQAELFESTILSASAALTSGLNRIASDMSGARVTIAQAPSSSPVAAALPASLPVVLPGGGGSSGGGKREVHVHLTVQGSLIYERQIADTVVKAVHEADRRGGFDFAHRSEIAALKR